MAQSLRLTVAKLMLSRALFDGDTAVGPDTIWRSQRPKIRESWLERADGFIADLDDRGFKIVEA